MNVKQLFEYKPAESYNFTLTPTNSQSKKEKNDNKIRRGIENKQKNRNRPS